MNGLFTLDFLHLLVWDCGYFIQPLLTKIKLELKMWYEWISVIGFIGILIIGVWVITSALDHRD